jgi:Arc/MetJ-type ribon-helix-helix transcriptional regulator
MPIKLTPDQEQIIQEEIQSGHFHTPDEVLDHALAALREKQERVRRAQAAAAKIRELSRGLSLGGLKVKDLIEEGRM